MSVLEGRTGSIYWDDAGDADAPGLLLVHSLGSDSRMWNDQLSDLAALRRVVWMDLPGAGNSGAAPGEYTLDDLGHDVVLVASAAGLETFDLCGVSLGGLISLWVAINHPGRVNRLIPCSTAPKVGTAEMWSERIDTISTDGLGSMQDALVPRFITSDLAQRRPEAHRLVYDMFDAIDDTGYVGCCAALRDADISDEVATIETPTLIVAGADDVATPPSVMEPIHNAIPDSQMEVVEGAAHLINIDQPEEFNSILTGFLA